MRNIVVAIVGAGFLIAGTILLGSCQALRGDLAIVALIFSFGLIIGGVLISMAAFIEPKEKE